LYREVEQQLAQLLDELRVQIIQAPFITELQVGLLKKINDQLTQLTAHKAVQTFIKSRRDFGAIVTQLVPRVNPNTLMQANLQRLGEKIEQTQRDITEKIRTMTPKELAERAAALRAQRGEEELSPLSPISPWSPSASFSTPTSEASSMPTFVPSIPPSTVISEQGSIPASPYYMPETPRPPLSPISMSNEAPQEEVFGPPAQGSTFTLAGPTPAELQLKAEVEALKEQLAQMSGVLSQIAPTFVSPSPIPVSSESPALPGVEPMVPVLPTLPIAGMDTQEVPVAIMPSPQVPAPLSQTVLTQREFLENLPDTLKSWYSTWASTALKEKVISLLPEAAIATKLPAKILLASSSSVEVPAKALVRLAYLNKIGQTERAQKLLEILSYPGKK
jgi:hypothetical protein